MHIHTYDELPTFEKIHSQRRLFSARKDQSALRRELAVGLAKSAGCTKLAFPSKADAQERMRQANSSIAPSHRTLRNAYRCANCDQWHLTSQSRRPRTNTRQ